MYKFAIVDFRTGKECIKSFSEEIIREAYKAYSRGWGNLSGYGIITKKCGDVAEDFVQ